MKITEKEMVANVTNDIAKFTDSGESRQKLRQVIRCLSTENIKLSAHLAAFSSNLQVAKYKAYFVAVKASSGELKETKPRSYERNDDNRVRSGGRKPKARPVQSRKNR